MNLSKGTYSLILNKFLAENKLKTLRNNYIFKLIIFFPTYKKLHKHSHLASGDIAFTQYYSYVLKLKF